MMDFIGKDNVQNKTVAYMTYDEAILLMKACGIPAANRATTVHLDLGPISNQLIAINTLKPVANQINQISQEWANIANTINNALGS